MTPEQRQEALKSKGITQASIARELGVTPMMVSKVIHHNTVSDRIMRAISAAIGCDHKVVFHEYYSQKPKRITSKSGD